MGNLRELPKRFNHTNGLVFRVRYQLPIRRRSGGLVFARVRGQVSALQSRCPPGTGSNLAMDAKELNSLVTHLEANRSLFNTNRLRKRFEVLDQLDAYFEDADAQARSADRNYGPIYDRARTVRNKLEAANSAVFRSIRNEVLQGGKPRRLLRCIEGCRNRINAPAPGLGYDCLDELISGVLELREPCKGDVRPGFEMVFYQPTPMRHILDLIEIAKLCKRDVLVDLGSGLGHVPTLTSILIGNRGIGIELENAYVESARDCANRLGLSRVMFLQKDVRNADLSSGTVFYLYTPFTGELLRTVLGRLQAESLNRTIRVCTLGPCTSVVARETWLRPDGTPDPDRVTCFWSKFERS